MCQLTQSSKVSALRYALVAVRRNRPAPLSEPPSNAGNREGTVQWGGFLWLTFLGRARKCSFSEDLPGFGQVLPELKVSSRRATPGQNSFCKAGSSSYRCSCSAFAARVNRASINGVLILSVAQSRVRNAPARRFLRRRYRSTCFSGHLRPRSQAIQLAVLRLVPDGQPLPLAQKVVRRNG